MPYPGTPFWEEAGSKGWIEDYDFSKYDMFHPVMSSETLSREEIAGLTQKAYKDFVYKQPIRYIRGLFSREAIRRRLHWWFLFSITRVLLRDLFLGLLGRKKMEGFAAVNKLWKPAWYDS
jgi:anaerobic magnesium-protoporphyrin IX monomethyl ester cyclase